MILHAASLMIFFADQMAQLPVEVHCASATPESWCKWLAQSLFQLLVSVIPVAGGVWIALWSFRATGKKDRERWVNDQKMAEWKELIQTVAEYETIMPRGEVGSATVDGVRFTVLPLCNRLSRLISQVLFVAPILSTNGIQSDLNKIMRDTDRAIGRIESFSQNSLSQEDKMAIGTPVENAMKIREQLQNLHSKLVSIAQADLSLS